MINWGGGCIPSISNDVSTTDDDDDEDDG